MENLSLKGTTGWPDIDSRPASRVSRKEYGAGNGDRTRDPQLGRLMLYQLSYSRPLICKRSCISPEPRKEEFALTVLHLSDHDIEGSR